MSSISILVVLFAIGIYGLLKLIVELRKFSTRHEFGVKFLDNLKKYWESGGRDSETYGWLIHRSNKMQGEMGGLGVVHNYKPPYQNYMITNYDIILNMIPELRKCLEDDLLSRNLTHQYISVLQESLVRYLGSIEDKQEKIIREIKNPIKWFRDGVRDIVALPAYLFGWLGVISETTAKKMVSSLLFSALSGIVALAGFVSAIVTIAIGWDAFLNVVNNLWP